MIHLAALVIGSLLSIPQEWSLNRCIEYGLKHSLEVKSGEISVEMEKNRHHQSKLMYTPTVSANGVFDLHPERVFSPVIGASLTIFDGLGRYYGTRSSEAAVAISGYELEHIRFSKIITVTQTYLDILLSMEMERIAHESYTTITGQLEKSEKFLENGRTTLSSHLELEAQKSAEEANWIKLQHIIRSKIITLTHLINYPHPEDFSISSEIPDKVMRVIEWGDIDKTYLLAISLPFIRSAQMQVKQAEYEKRRANSAISPTLSLQWGYDLKWQQSTLGLHISIPIFNQGHTLTNIKNSALSHQSAGIELQRRQQELYSQIQQVVTEGISLYQEYLASLKGVEAAEIAYSLASEQYDQGAIDNFELHRVRTNMVKAKSALAQTKYKYIFQVAILELYSGEKW